MGAILALLLGHLHVLLAPGLPAAATRRWRDTPTITVRLGFDLHDLTFAALDSAEPFPNSGSDGVRVIVHDP